MREKKYGARRESCLGGMSNTLFVFVHLQEQVNKMVRYKIYIVHRYYVTSGAPRGCRAGTFQQLEAWVDFWGFSTFTDYIGTENIVDTMSVIPCPVFSLNVDIGFYRDHRPFCLLFMYII